MLSTAILSAIMDDDNKEDDNTPIVELIFVYTNYKYDAKGERVELEEGRRAPIKQPVIPVFQIAQCVPENADLEDGSTAQQMADEMHRLATEYIAEGGELRMPIYALCLRKDQRTIEVLDTPKMIFFNPDDQNLKDFVEDKYAYVQTLQSIADNCDAICTAMVSELWAEDGARELRVIVKHVALEDDIVLEASWSPPLGRFLKPTKLTSSDGVPVKAGGRIIVLLPGEKSL